MGSDEGEKVVLSLGGEPPTKKDREDLWLWIARVAGRQAAVIEIPRGAKPAELAVSLRRVSAALMLADKAKKLLLSDQDEAVVIGKPLESACQSGAARQCGECDLVFDVRLAPDLERPDMEIGICPECSVRYTPALARTRADKTLMPPAPVGPWRLPPPKTALEGAF